jgi:hypothetical protein
VIVDQGDKHVLERLAQELWQLQATLRSLIRQSSQPVLYRELHHRGMAVKAELDFLRELAQHDG